ncbi:MAG: cytochrome c biogenesis CcdA family protein [Patescibacteria group bacterium]
MNLTIPAIIGAAIIDSINPCAFAVLIFLLGYLSLIGSSKRVWRVGLIYIFTVFIVYFLAGLGLLKILTSLHLTLIISKVAAVLLIILGLVNLKDFFWYGKGISLAIPESKKPLLEKYIHRASIPGAIVLGFLVAAFELPCTGGIYLGVLCLMAEKCTRWQGILYLLLYNLIFVLPLLIILAVVYFGSSSAKLETWRMKYRRWMRLLAGLFLMVLGVLMLIGRI